MLTSHCGRVTKWFDASDQSMRTQSLPSRQYAQLPRLTRSMIPGRGVGRGEGHCSGHFFSSTHIHNTSRRKKRVRLRFNQLLGCQSGVGRKDRSAVNMWSRKSLYIHKSHCNWDHKHKKNLICVSLFLSISQKLTPLVMMKITTAVDDIRYSEVFLFEKPRAHAHARVIDGLQL